MNRDDTTAGLRTRLAESTAGTVDWSKAQAALSVASPGEAAKVLAQALVEARSELAQAKGAMALIIRTHAELAIVTTDTLGNVVSVTQEGAALLGWPVERIIGRPIDVVLADRLNATAESTEEMRTADSGASVSSERSHVRKDGTTFNAHHAIFALLGAHGQMIGFVRTIEDLTKREAVQLQIDELDATVALLLA